MIDPLESLLLDALTQAKCRKTKAGEPAPPKRPVLDSGVHNPDNWKRTRTISLIHTPSNTLLGNFVEWVYPRLPGTRKLVRVDAPTETEGLEHVTGDWWLTEPAERFAAPERWVEARECRIGISLTECGLHSPDAHVAVRLEHGYIARVELAEETRFTAPARDTFLILPCGLDVLGCMGFDSKLALKAEIGL